MSRTGWEGDGDVPPLETDGRRQQDQARKALRDRPPSGRSISRRHQGQFLLGHCPQLLPAVPFESLLALRPTNILQAPHLPWLFHVEVAFQSEDVSHLSGFSLASESGVLNLATLRCPGA